MARTVPYLLCRFTITVGDERLDAAGVREFLAESQGSEETYHTRADREDGSALVMEVEDVGADGVSFCAGYRPGVRSKQLYDAGQNKRTFVIEPDDHIKAAHIVAVPALGCMAIEDRTGERNIPQFMAIKAIRSVLDGWFEDEADIHVVHLTDDEVEQIINDWELIRYDYEVMPLNPIRLSDFNELRSEAMKQDRVARDAGRLIPAKGQTMTAGGGLVSETQEMVLHGYGQAGVRAITPEGDEARVPKAKFHENKTKNLAEREKPRYLKIMFESDEGVVDNEKIVATLVRFYG